jgi:hypothetical protein
MVVDDCSQRVEPVDSPFPKYLYQRVERGGRIDFVQEAKRALRFGMVRPKSEILLVPANFNGSIWQARCTDDVLKMIQDRFPFRNVTKPAARAEVSDHPRMVGQDGNEETPQPEERTPPTSDPSNLRIPKTLTFRASPS